MLQYVYELSQHLHISKLHEARPQQVIQQLAERLQQRPQRLPQRRRQRRCRNRPPQLAYEQKQQRDARPSRITCMFVMQKTTSPTVAKQNSYMASSWSKQEQHAQQCRLTLCLYAICLGRSLRSDCRAKELLQQLTLQLAGAQHLLCCSSHQLRQLLT